MTKQTTTDVFARGCAKALKVIAVIAAAIFVVLLAGLYRASAVNPFTVYGAATTALIAAAFAGLGLHYLATYRRLGADLRLVDDAFSGRLPTSGARAAFAGRIESDETIVTPFTALPAVAFRYKISERRSSGLTSTSGSMTDFTHFVGSALVASRIASTAGNFRLACFPDFGFDDALVPREEASKNFESYRATTPIEPPVERLTHRPVPSRDDEPSHRFDREHGHRDPLNWANADFRESAVAQGSDVVVFGWFDPARGIVADGSKTGRPVLYRGRAEATQTLTRLRRKWIVGGAVSFAIAAAIVTWFLAEVGILQQFSQALQSS